MKDKIISFLPAVEQGTLVNLIGRYFWLAPHGSHGSEEVSLGLTTGKKVVRQVIVSDRGRDLKKRFLNHFIKNRGGVLVFDNYKPLPEGAGSGGSSFFWEAPTGDSDSEFVPELMGWIVRI